MLYRLSPSLYFILGILFFIEINPLVAQKQVQGSVYDELEQPLPFASVILLHSLDSTIIAHTTTNDVGAFSLDLKTSINTYVLRINYVGYEPLQQNIVPPLASGQVVQLGSIKLHPLSKTLSEAVIVAQREPVKLKGDTMAFDAKAFATQPNDVAADIIKKLPGVEIEKDGTLQAQGEQVRQILVNGKPFFGSDPQIALQNLPADAIESIEVYDKKSDQAEFTGIDDGNRQKTINIKLKPHFTRQSNGRLTGGYGTDNRYMGRMNWNSFTEKQKITVLGSANNVNTMGFAEEDFAAFTGQNKRDNSHQKPQAAASKGFQSMQSGGINFTNQFSTKTDLTSSYFYNQQKTLTDRLLNRQNFLISGTYFTHLNSIADVTNGNHRFNLQLEHKFDSLTSIRLTSSLSISKNTNDYISASENLKGDTLLQNRQARHTFTEGSGLGSANNFLIRRKLHKTGRTMSLNLAYNRNTSDRFNTLLAKINYFNSLKINYRNDTIDQTDKRGNTKDSYSSSLSYTEPLSKKAVLEANYRFGTSENYANREIFSLQNGEYQFNTVLSNQYSNDFLYHRIGTTFRFTEGSRYNFTISSQYQNSTLAGNFITLRDSIKRTFSYFLPTLRLEYTVAPQKRLNFHYETDVNEPSIDQLQPVRDNSDPMNLFIGNPHLKPEYNNRLRLMYSSFNKKSFTYFNGNINGIYTTQKIANQVTIDTSLRRTTIPINTASATQFSAHTALGFRFWRNRIRLNWTTNSSYSNSISLINNQENATQRMSAATSLRAELNLPDTFEISLKATTRYNQTDYSLQANLSQWFVNYNYEAEIALALPHNMRIRSAFDYAIFTGKSFGTTQGIPLLSLSFSKYLDKSRKNEIKLLVVDALNRNTGINRYADGNYVQEERIRSLGRYGMLSFTYFIK